VANQAGTFQSFNYQADDGSKWSASLQGAELDEFGTGVTNPIFSHVGPSPANNGSHTDAHINYITGNGSKWTSICCAHSSTTSDGPVTFTFQHFQFGSSNFDHESSNLEVIDWDGSIWEITVQPLYISLDETMMVVIVAGPAVGTAPAVLPPVPATPNPYSPKRDV
jgi:hypothetical protein